MDLCDIDRAALGHRIAYLRSAEVDGRGRDARRPADPRDQVPENPLGTAARHGSAGLGALSDASPAPFRGRPDIRRRAGSAAALHCGQRDLRRAGRQRRHRIGDEASPASARSAAHVCGACAARQSSESKPKRRAHGGACDLHGSRQHLRDLLVSGGHPRPHARRRCGR